jgi:outer membrane protein W
MPRCLVLAALAIVVASPAQAQDGKIELSVFGGGGTSAGYDLGRTVVDPTTLTAYDGVSFGSGAVVGGGIGYYFTPQMEIELAFSQMAGKFSGQRVDGADDDEFTDVAINHLHAYFIYNVGEGDKKVRPFVGLGLGATIFSLDEFRGNDIDSESYFSGSLTAGIKAALGKTLGLRLQAKVTPTYIASTTEGYWCGWGACWPQEDAHYATQASLTAGLNLRFGPADEDSAEF